MHKIGDLVPNFKFSSHKIHMVGRAFTTYKRPRISIVSVSPIPTAKVAMSDSIRFFKFIRELFETMGLHPYQSNQNHSYNWRNSLILLFLVLMFIASTAFLLFEANSIDEFGKSFYIDVLTLLLILLWPCFIRNTGDFFKLMDQMEQFGQMRELKKKIPNACISKIQWRKTLLFFNFSGSDPISKLMHGKVSERIERVCKTTYFYNLEVFEAVTVSLTIVQTAINYYISDLGDEAFYLPCLVMYVHYLVSNPQRILNCIEIWIIWIFRKYELIWTKWSSCFRLCYITHFSAAISLFII